MNFLDNALPACLNKSKIFTYGLLSVSEFRIIRNSLCKIGVHVVEYLLHQHPVDFGHETLGNNSL